MKERLCSGLQGVGWKFAMLNAAGERSTGATQQHRWLSVPELFRSSCGLAGAMQHIPCRIPGVRGKLGSISASVCKHSICGIACWQLQAYGPNSSGPEQPWVKGVFIEGGQGRRYRQRSPLVI